MKIAKVDLTSEDVKTMAKAYYRLNQIMPKTDLMVEVLARFKELIHDLEQQVEDEGIDLKIK